jgi:hypothetical protein
MFPGLPGVLVGLGLFPLVWLLACLASPHKPVHFDALGEKDAFLPLLGHYLDIVKVLLGLASGSIVLLVGSAAFRSAGRLPASFASPLFLLALSIIYGVLFMVLMMLDYENYRHHPNDNTYTRNKYSRNQALGFSALLCFCFGYVWLIFIVVTGQP